MKSPFLRCFAATLPFPLSLASAPVEDAWFETLPSPLQGPWPFRSPSTSGNHGFGIYTAGSEFSFSDVWTVYCLFTAPSKSVHGGET